MSPKIHSPQQVNIPVPWNALATIVWSTPTYYHTGPLDLFFVLLEGLGSHGVHHHAPWFTTIWETIFAFFSKHRGHASPSLKGITGSLGWNNPYKWSYNLIFNGRSKWPRMVFRFRCFSFVYVQPRFLVPHEGLPVAEHFARKVPPASGNGKGMPLPGIRKGADGHYKGSTFCCHICFLGKHSIKFVIYGFRAGWMLWIQDKFISTAGRKVTKYVDDWWLPLLENLREGGYSRSVCVLLLCQKTFFQAVSLPRLHGWKLPWWRPSRTGLHLVTRDPQRCFWTTHGRILCCLGREKSQLFIALCCIPSKRRQKLVWFLALDFGFGILDLGLYNLARVAEK